MNYAPRHLLPLLFFFLHCTGVRAQTDPQYTQFMLQPTAYNPAAAGATESGHVTVLARQQWLGFEGGPESQQALLSLPLNSAGTGLGLRLQQASIGLEQQYAVEGSFAYRFAIGRGTRMGLGISATARQYGVDFTRARPVQGGVDQAIPGGNATKIVPNFGAGAYVDGPGFYVGIGVPRLLANNLDLGDEETVIGREARHFYFQAGTKFHPSDKVALEPQVLAKYVIGAPFDADFNLTAYLGDNLFLGANYRLGGNGTGESASAQAGFFLGGHLMLALAYDLGLSELAFAHDGSVEAVVRYSFGRRARGGAVIDPRDALQ